MHLGKVLAVHLSSACDGRTALLATALSTNVFTPHFFGTHCSLTGLLLVYQLLSPLSSKLKGFVRAGYLVSSAANTVLYLCTSLMSWSLAACSSGGSEAAIFPTVSSTTSFCVLSGLPPLSQSSKGLCCVRPSTLSPLSSTLMCVCLS